jgi:hypothetical protein
MAGFLQNLFGFVIKKSEIDKKATSIVPPEGDGASVIETAAAGGAGMLSQILDLDSDAKTENELIKKYRTISLLPEVETAIDDIVNESIITDEIEDPVKLNMDKVTKVSDAIKKQIVEEFSEILRLLDFQTNGYDIFKKFYVDGRLYYDKIINDSSPSKGILSLRQIDPLTINKVKEVIKTKDPKTGIDVEKEVQEFFIYTPKPRSVKTGLHSSRLVASQILKVSVDRIAFIHSGVIDAEKQIVLSHLHKAIKPINQLQLIEDSTVIYRLSRAPERKVFYIDVGNIPTTKAEQYLAQVMNKYKNKTIYNSATGEVVNQKHHLSMMEDYFLPRREGNKGTEISTLPGGAGLADTGEITDYFRKKLYHALNVPFSRVEGNTTFGLGRSTEITRDEIKFGKFITRLRNRFTMLFNDLLGTQVVLKGIMKFSEWQAIKQDLNYDFLRDSHFTEIKEAELLATRLELLGNAKEYVGTFLSNTWVNKNILQMDDEEIEKIKKDIALEKKVGEIPSEDDEDEEPEDKATPKVFTLKPVADKEPKASNG